MGTMPRYSRQEDRRLEELAGLVGEMRIIMAAFFYHELNVLNIVIFKSNKLALLQKTPKRQAIRGMLNAVQKRLKKTCYMRHVKCRRKKIRVYTHFMSRIFGNAIRSKLYAVMLYAGR